MITSQQVFLLQQELFAEISPPEDRKIMGILYFWNFLLWDPQLQFTFWLDEEFDLGEAADDDELLSAFSTRLLFIAELRRDKF